MLRLCFVRFSAEQGQLRGMLIINYYLPKSPLRFHSPDSGFLVRDSVPLERFGTNRLTSQGMLIINF